jgi:hypothetical protein
VGNTVIDVAGGQVGRYCGFLLFFVSAGGGGYSLAFSNKWVWPDGVGAPKMPATVGSILIVAGQILNGENGVGQILGTPVRTYTK